MIEVTSACHRHKAVSIVCFRNTGTTVMKSRWMSCYTTSSSFPVQLSVVGPQPSTNPILRGHSWPMRLYLIHCGFAEVAKKGPHKWSISGINRGRKANSLPKWGPRYPCLVHIQSNTKLWPDRGHLAITRPAVDQQHYPCSPKATRASRQTIQGKPGCRQGQDWSSRSYVPTSSSYQHLSSQFINSSFFRCVVHWIPCSYWNRSLHSMSWINKEAVLFA